MIDLIEQTESIRRRYEQYHRLFQQGELEKAEEVLWSIIVVMLDAISMLVQGRPLRRHRELKIFVKTELAQLYNSLTGGDPVVLVKLFENAERLHANFYHEFLDAEELLNYIGAAELLAQILNELLDMVIKKALGSE